MQAVTEKRDPGGTGLERTGQCQLSQVQGHEHEHDMDWGSWQKSISGHGAAPAWALGVLLVTGPFLVPLSRL